MSWEIQRRYEMMGFNRPPHTPIHFLGQCITAYPLPRQTKKPQSLPKKRSTPLTPPLHVSVSSVYTDITTTLAWLHDTSQPYQCTGRARKHVYFPGSKSQASHFPQGPTTYHLVLCIKRQTFPSNSKISFQMPKFPYN